tara:strand:+ start:323 stop:493 length:171 start_codon:yes stop_codon:yes gene_type:complete
MQRTLLFLFFVALGIVGFWLIWHRTGNYDIDFITKLIGWILLIPAILGIIDSLRLI